MTNMSDQLDRELTHRLPTHIIPSHYQLYIDVSQLDQYLFQGIVDIDIQVSQFKIIFKKKNFNV